MDSDPPPPRTSADRLPGTEVDARAELAWALTLLAAARRLPVDPVLLRETLAQSEAQRPLLERLTEPALPLGLRVTRLDLGLEMVERAARELPLVTATPTGRLVAVVGARGGRLRVAMADGSEVWLTPAALALRLGVTPHANVAMASAELAFPLTGTHGAAASGEDDDHGPGHGARGHDAFGRVWALARLDRDDIGTILVHAVFIGLTSLAVPVAVQALVNTVVFGALVQPLVVLSLAVLLVLSLSGVLRALQAWVIERLQERIFVRAALEVAHRLPRIRVEAFDAVHAPEKVNRFFDALTAQKAAAALLTDGTALVLQAGLGMLLLGFYHPFLLAFDVFLTLSVLAIVLGLGRSAVRTSLAESRAKYAVAGWLQDVARGPTAFRHHPAAALERADDLARGYLLARRAHFRVLFRQIVASFALQAIASALLLAVGGWLVLEGQLTVGQLVAAEIVVSSVLAGVAKLGKQLEATYDLATALEKLGTLTDLPLEAQGGVRALPEGRPARLDLVDVSFHHRGGRPVHERVALTVEAGARVAILGPTGSGKTSLADLVFRLREPSHGSILLDGIDVREVDPEHYRRHVAFVRDPEIVDGTVYDNVALGRPGVSPDDVQRALAMMGLGEVVARLPRGVRTRLLPGGRPLSLGETNRLAIARAVAGKPRLLVIDGLLDGLDPATLGELETCLGHLDGRTTLVVLTGDPRVAAWCERTHRLEPRRPTRPSSPPERAPALAPAGGVS